MQLGQKPDGLLPKSFFVKNLPHSIRKVLSLFAGAPSPTLLRVPLHLNVGDPAPSRVPRYSFLPAPGAQAEMHSHIHLPHICARTLEALKMVPRSLRNAPFGNTFQTKYSYGWVWATGRQDLTPILFYWDVIQEIPETSLNPNGMF